MNLLEVFEQETDGYRTEKDDNTTLKLSDLRKTKLTLMQLNKLRKMNDTRTFEYNEKLKDIRTQYAPAAAPAA